MGRLDILRAALFLSAGFGLAAPAFAQPTGSPPVPVPAPVTGQQGGGGTTSAPTAGGPGDTKVEEIVVTAQRVQQSLQKTPIAVTAYTGRQLEASGVQTVRDVVQTTPNLEVNRPIGSDGSNIVFYIRGLGLPRGGLGLQPAVGVYVDDIYYPSLNGGLLRVLDLSSLEILRGPQGTLFGRNTLGGAVRYNTRQPSVGEGFDGHLDFTGGSYGELDFNGAVNMPITDTLAVRVSAGRYNNDGFIKDVTTGKDVGGAMDNIARVQVRYTPTSKITDDVSLGFSEENNHGQPWTLAGVSGDSSGKTTGLVSTFNDGVLVGPPGHQFYVVPPAPAFAQYDSRYLLNCRYCAPGTNQPDVTDNHDFNATNTLSYRLSDNLTIKSLTGFFYVTTFDRIDLDRTPTLLVEDEYSKQAEKEVSQEIQVSGAAFNSRLHYIGGLYYTHYTLGDTRDSGGLTPVVGPPPASVLAGDMISFSSNETSSYAAYGQTTLAITDKLTGVVGLRYSLDDVGVTSQQSLTNVPPTGITPTIIPPESHFHNLSPAFKLQYQWTPRIMSYLSVSKGYRSGTINTSGSLSPSIGLSPVKPDTIWTYEGGLRSQLFDRHLELNLTGFTSNYTGEQLLFVYPTPPGIPVPPTLFANAGNATIRGVELESRGTLGPWQFRVSGSYLDSYYTKLTAPPVDPVVGPAVAALTLDSPLEHAPKFTYSLGATYSLDLPVGALHISGEWSYQSSQASTATDADRQTLPGYRLLNFRANYDINRNWTVAVGIQNALNEYYYLGGADLRTALGPDYYEPGTPRTITASLRYSF